MSRPGAFRGATQVLVFCWWAAFAGAAGAAAADSPIAFRGSAPALKLAEPDRGGLLALVDGSLALWGQGGRLQIRNPLGAWSGVIQLPLDAIAQAVADDAGLLVSGSRESPAGTSPSGVVLVDPQGAVQDRWDRPELIFSVASQAGKRWATVSGKRPLPFHQEAFDPEQKIAPIIDQLIALAPGGKVAPGAKVELNAMVTALASGTPARARIDCVPANRARESYHPAYCAATGPAGWRKAGVWDRPPIACGAYLIEVYDKLGGGDKPLREQAPQVVARRLDDGQVAARQPLAPGHAVACGGPGELLLGRSGVRALSLPDLKPLWHRVAARGRVVAVARSGDSVWAAMSSGTVVPIKIPPTK